MKLNELSLSGMAEAICSGEASAAEVLEACLLRIAERESEVGAFEFLDPDYAMAQLKTGGGGPLEGLPIGVKDIFDTVDMPTGWGSRIYAGHRPVRDAGSVRQLRHAGAVIAGKTVTTEFAYFHPGKTRNPHDLERTPGGSSMGSAAAVADLMLPAALGSQTAASVIRPAAYCGVIGYKSSQGAFDLGGACGLAQSLDSLGFFVRELADLTLLRNAYLGVKPLPASDHARKLGLVRTPHWSEAGADTHSLFETVSATLSSNGAILEDVEIGPADGALTEAHNTVMAFEAARTRAYEVDAHVDLVSDKFKALVTAGRATSYDSYRTALALAEDWRRRLAALFQRFDLLLAPSAPGEAPVGLNATGDPLFSRMWTLLQVPSLTLPAGKGAHGLPLGLQLIGAFSEDDRLIRDAAWVTDRL